jgi:hypothetical protein
VPKVNNRPLGENSSNLVTLFRSNNTSGIFASRHEGVFEQRKMKDETRFSLTWG